MKLTIALFAFAGLFLIRSEVEEIVTSFIPGSWEIPIGLGLLGYAIYRYNQKRGK